MAQPHNIAGSEAFDVGPKLIIREMPRRRPGLSLAAKIYMGSAIAALVSALVDIAIGQPICLTIAASIFLVAWLRG